MSKTPSIELLLELSKSIAEKSAKQLMSELKPEGFEYQYDSEVKKEVKAKVDVVLEKMILPPLLETGISVLSEESGYIHNDDDSDYMFCLDPLDGTFNFLKGVGPSAISIALYKEGVPDEYIFGVIYNLSTQELIWGGKNLGSYCNGIKISVSETERMSEAVFFTGFPARFDFDLDNKLLWDLYKNVAKVRMIGSAAVSLVNVALGKGDAYFEEKIMMWDVAAGIAIVEGAGGIVDGDKLLGASTEDRHSAQSFGVGVLATNKKLHEEIGTYCFKLLNEHRKEITGLES